MLQRLKIITDTSAIKNNVRQIKKRLKPSTRIMAIVKADGYGHGEKEAAESAFGEGVTDFGVATAEEAIFLREQTNIKNNAEILVLGARESGDQAKKCVRLGITQTVSDFAAAAKIAAAAKELGVKAKIHIKIDTGMNRIGFPPNDGGIEGIVAASRFEELEMTGIFSHFVESQAADTSFSDGQALRFTDCVKKLKSAGINLPLMHISNSAGVMLLPQYQFDMVRPGIILYGLPPSKNIGMEASGFLPALSVKSEVSFVKEIPEGMGVSYDRTFVTKRPSKIATIPIGYADSYPRALSNKGYVLIHGKAVPIIGNICMDQMMADVTGIEDAAPGDEVILIGKSEESGLKISAELVAEWAGTICYEIVCAMGNGRRSKKIVE